MNSEGVEICKLCLFLRFLPFFPAAKRFFFLFLGGFPDGSEDLRTEEVVH